MNPFVSVIIRTKNESKYLGRVLNRLKEQQYEGSVEIILVDSGSTDNTVSIAEEFGCRIILLKPEEFSFGRALNLGIEHTRGEIIVNLSGHSVPVNTDYFTIMVEPFEDSNVAATFGRDIPWPEACPSQARDILSHFPEAGLNGNKFSNANAAIRKECWKKVDFNEGISASEDLLWAKQIMNLGYKIQYLPEATVFHSHKASPGYIFRRSVYESKSMNGFTELKHMFGVRQLIKFFLGHTLKDAIFTLKKGYNPLWLFHIPFYRFAQSIGLYIGFKEGAQIHMDALSKVGQYNFEKRRIKDRKKVLMVTHCFFPESVGGTEYYTLNLAKKLNERGWDVIIVSALRDLTQKRYKVLESKYDGLSAIKIVNSPELCTKFTEYFIDHNVDNIFSEILKTEKPDLVHFQHTAYLSARLPEIVNQLDIPSVFTLHDYWYMCYRSQLIRPSEGVCPGPSDGLYCATCFDPVYPNQAGVPRIPILNKMLQMPLLRQLNIKERLSPELKMRIKRFLYKRENSGNNSTGGFSSPDIWHIMEHSFRMEFMKRQLTFPAFVISPSKHLKKRYEKEGFREIIYIPHGFEPKVKIKNAPFKGELVLAYLSNIIPFKGADVILRELRYVNEKQNLRILLYGKILDDAYQKELETLAQEYSDANISFMGPYKGKDVLEKLLGNVHFVVFPSLWEENHPLVVKEALSHGVPVITSSLGGAPEAIEDGVNGFIFDPYMEGDLAGTINRILRDPSVIDKVTEGARKTEIESIEDHVEKIIKLYNNVVGK